MLQTCVGSSGLNSFLDINPMSWSPIKSSSAKSIRALMDAKLTCSGHANWLYRQVFLWYWYQIAMSEKVWCGKAKPQPSLIVGSGMTILEVLIRGFLLSLLARITPLYRPIRALCPLHTQLPIKPWLSGRQSTSTSFTSVISQSYLKISFKNFSFTQNPDRILVIHTPQWRSLSTSSGQLLSQWFWFWWQFWGN